MANKIVFQTADVGVIKVSKKWLKESVAQVFAHETNRPYYLQYIFCSDEYLLNINKTYLQHDYYTDIITFDLSEKRSEIIISDLYISIDRIKDNAKALQIHWQEELQRVCVHGALHLCGYGDKTKKEQEAMREKENYYINLTVSRGT